MQKNNKPVAANVIKKIAGKAATMASGSASWWGLHQIKEPKSCKKA